MSPLVDPPDLHAVAREAGVAVLDVRWSLTGPPGRETYEQGHLPGAVFVDLDAELAAPPGPAGRHPLPGAQDFTAAMRRAGVDNGRPVVVYDQRDATSAARAWWLLRDGGHGDVRVLDGGYDGWVAAGLPVETGPGPTPRSGDFVGSPGQLPVLTADDAGALARRGVLLDSRAVERYRGEVEPVDPVAGHVPGAVSAPVSANVRPDGRFRPVAELCERFARLGVEPGAEVGAYCGSGVVAAHQLLALEIAGVAAALWPGSWSEWVAEPGRADRPVATGPDPG